jgi:thioredoxin-dependent adenylylsulfate APS reductase
MTTVQSAEKIDRSTDLEILSSELRAGSAEDVLGWALNRYGDRIALCTSFQAEGMVLLDMAHRIDPDVRVFTIDTGRLPQETYDLIDLVRERYDISIEVHYPDGEELANMTETHGLNLFRRSVSLRLLCCEARKVKPLYRALAGLDAWITGLRRSQSAARASVAKIETDDSHNGMLKLNPLADWSIDRVWEYVRTHDVPHNDLYDQGYTSIGCAPCTRAIKPGEDVRAGRWWWETGAAKECGIHLSPGMRNGGHAGSGPHRGGRG